MSVVPPQFTILPNGLAPSLSLSLTDRLSYYPQSVAISPDSSVIVGGAAFWDTSDIGIAYVFRRDTGTDQWIYSQELRPSIVAATLRFGTCVAIRSDDAVIAVGGPSNLGGRVFLYTFNPATNTYSYSQQLSGTATSGTTQLFGNAVSFDESGQYLVVGAPGSNYTRIYSRSSTGLYLQQQEISGPIASANFGWSAKISPNGEYVVVGAPFVGYPGGLTNRGMAFVYKKDTGTANWSLVYNLSTPNVAAPQFANVLDLSYDGTYGVFSCTQRSSFFFKKDLGTESWTNLQVAVTSDTLNTGWGPLTSMSYTGEIVAIGNRVLPISDMGGVLYYQKKPNEDSWQLLSTIQTLGIGLQRRQFQGTGGMVSADGTYLVYGGYGYASDRGNIYISYRDWLKPMPSTTSLGLVGLASTSRVSVVLPKAISTLSQMSWIKDFATPRSNYAVLTVSTTGGDRLDSRAIPIAASSLGMGFQFVHDGLSNWYTLTYSDGN